MNEDWIHYKTSGTIQYCRLIGITIWEYKRKTDYETGLIKDQLKENKNLLTDLGLN